MRTGTSVNNVAQSRTMELWKRCAETAQQPGYTRIIANPKKHLIKQFDSRTRSIMQPTTFATNPQQIAHLAQLKHQLNNMAQTDLITELRYLEQLLFHDTRMLNFPRRRLYQIAVWMAPVPLSGALSQSQPYVEQAGYFDRKNFCCFSVMGWPSRPSTCSISSQSIRFTLSA
jgi:hypothetical protein